MYTCGTHFAGTKDPASMVVTPVFANFSMSCSFVSSGIDFFSFCRPSRGPTSTMRTWSEVSRASVAKSRAGGAARKVEKRFNLGRKAMIQGNAVWPKDNASQRADRECASRLKRGLSSCYCLPTLHRAENAEKCRLVTLVDPT